MIKSNLILPKIVKISFFAGFGGCFGRLTKKGNCGKLKARPERTVVFVSIVYSEKENLFLLNTKTSSYVIKIYREGYLLGLHYGGKVPDVSFDGQIFRDWFPSFSPNNPAIGEGEFSPDVSPLEYSGFGAGDFRKTPVAIRNADGNNVTDFRYVSHTVVPGKPALPGLPATFSAKEGDCETLTLLLKDRATGLEAELLYTVFEDEGVMARSVRLHNPTKSPAVIEKAASASINLPEMDYDFVHLYGRWNAERNFVRQPLGHGAQGISSLRGSSSHYHNPFAALVRRGADEDHGEVYGFNFVYSGNFDITVDCDYYESTRVNIGINPDGFSWLLAPGESFQTPEVVTVYTDKGLGEMSRIFSRFYRKHLIRGPWKDKRRPLLINSWEAAYFDFDSDKLVAFARRAKEIGVELLVMDDGWFGRRNDDRSSLGDWWVNEDKLPGGLAELVRRVNAEGLAFGIWFEPEMISPDSDLFRAHPDFALGVPGRERLEGRHQYVLDMSRADVRDYLFDKMSAILSSAPIAYVKWDFNRNLTDAGSLLLPKERGEEIFHRFVLGTYELMGRLLSAFPDLLLENCSGGGGRFDPGMLYYSPQIWASDNTDAIERLAVQFGTSLCYPASTMGAHVSMNPRTGFETKGNVALWGTFGFELDPRALSEKDLAIAKGQAEDYFKYYDLIHEGDLYRLIAPWENTYRVAWSFVSADQSEALVTVVNSRFYHNPRFFLRLKGLDAGANYRVEESGERFSGAFLMRVGLNLSRAPHGTGESYRLHFIREK